MTRKLTLLFAFLLYSAINLLAAIDIVQTNAPLAKLAVESYTDGTVTQFEQNQIDAMLLQDIKVSDHMEAVANPFKNGFDKIPSAAELRSSNIEILLKYKLSKTQRGFSLDLKIIDQSKPIPTQLRFSIPDFKEYPFLSHNVAVSVNDYLKAPSIDWMKNFVLLSKDMGAKKSDIVIADYTLTYQKTLISGGYNIFPKWSGNGQTELYYTAYEKIPTLYRYNIYSGKKTRIISSEGMLVCSDVSRDGSKLLITMPSGALPDVFLYDTRTRTKTDLTNFAGIDVNANFIENEQKIAFVSDRLGYPTVFTKPINSPMVEQLIFSPRYNSTFSAKNDLLVYAGRDSSGTNLYLVNTKTGQKRQVTASGHNTSPRLSNAGDAIMFFKNDHSKTYLGIFRLNSSSTFLFPMNFGRIKSLDW
ncbi:MAG: Tol-Pal system protein TolB [Campylobacterales bacterium]|nr:Tol-Pal system protein TolB [Campylobacterales bacterium]